MHSDAFVRVRKGICCSGMHCKAPSTYAAGLPVMPFCCATEGNLGFGRFNSNPLLDRNRATNAAMHRACRVDVNKKISSSARLATLERRLTSNRRMNGLAWASDTVKAIHCLPIYSCLGAQHQKKRLRGIMDRTRSEFYCPRLSARHSAMSEKSGSGKRG